MTISNVVLGIQINNLRLWRASSGTNNRFSVISRHRSCQIRRRIDNRIQKGARRNWRFLKNLRRNCRSREVRWGAMQKHCRGLFTRYGYPREIGPCEKLENAARARISLSLSSSQCQAASQFISQPMRRGAVRCGALARAARHSSPTCLPFSLSPRRSSPRWTSARMYS